MANETLIAFCTFPDSGTATKITNELVGDRLVACGNILPAVQSIYRWQGKIESAQEVLAVFKLSSSRYSEFEKKIRSLHPYEVPEIIAYPIERGYPEYLRWVAESCAS
jgi:periplasmic divalent cation tolerance protein